MKKPAILSVFVVLVVGCAEPTPQVPSPAVSGQKDYFFPIKDFSDLDAVTSTTGGIEFPAKSLGAVTDNRGITTLTLQLEPAYGGAPAFSELEEYKQKVIPLSSNGTIVKISSRELPKASLKSYRMRVTMNDQGKATRLTFHVTGKNLVRSVKTKGDNYETTFNDGSSNFTVTTAHMNAFPVGQFNNPSFWDGEAGTEVILSQQEWWICPIESGPESADYSFLETNAKRGEFD